MGRRVLREITPCRQAGREKRRSRRMAPAERTERWFQDEGPSIGVSTRDAEGIRVSARPQPVPRRMRRGAGSIVAAANSWEGVTRGSAGNDSGRAEVATT